MNDDYNNLYIFVRLNRDVRQNRGWSLFWGQCV